MNAINCQACNASLNLELSRNGIVNCEYCNTTHNLSREVTLKCNMNNHSFAVKLTSIIKENFGLLDLQNLVHELSGVDAVLYYGLDWEDLPGISRSSKSLELVMWCKRRGFLKELVEVLIVKRPSIIGELI